ncbi:protocatechuate 3,4-dioxygenase [Neptunomonas japonica]|jgi:protocatechuate 3,4-dioxygenase beta subunit|uniref:dioxygenase family protein n=1 Tax=Neptunomonas japonica TaxID=417574 RepID=UPI000401DA59|nr:protocatechuate 3,4-dioxygenase [Neptunomonas japonica]
MNKISKSRRSILSGLAVTIGGLIFLRGAKASNSTPRATEGPFYPTESMRTQDIDNDLVKVQGNNHKAIGEVITLEGTIKDQNGAPLNGLRIEIWQCDLNGKYLHTEDTRTVMYDQSFQGFGHDITGPDGRYSFRTIKPGKYPGRTPHIHVKVLDSKRELLTTQFYEANNPENIKDSLFRRMSDDQAEFVLMRYLPADHGEVATVNIVL